MALKNHFNFATLLTRYQTMNQTQLDQIALEHVNTKEYNRTKIHTRGLHLETKSKLSSNIELSNQSGLGNVYQIPAVCTRVTCSSINRTTLYQRNNPQINVFDIQSSGIKKNNKKQKEGGIPIIINYVLYLMPYWLKINFYSTVKNTKKTNS